MYNNTLKLRKIRLKNRGKNILLICIIILLISCYISLTGLLEKEAFGSTSNTNRIVVNKGDTLWGLAKKHGPINQDIRKTVYQIKKINNITTRHIKPGEVLLLP